MSVTEKLLSNIKEYYQLLGFLDAKHPEVLREWKGSSMRATTKTEGDVTDTDGQNRHGYKQ